MSVGKVLMWIFLPLLLLGAAAGGLVFWRKSSDAGEAATKAAADAARQKAAADAAAAKAAADAQAAAGVRPRPEASASVVDDLKGLIAMGREGVALYNEIQAGLNG